MKWAMGRCALLHVRVFNTTYVSKRSLQELISRLQTIDLTTFAACGDVVRTVVSCAAPIYSTERQDLHHYVMELSRELKPHMRAYFEIWLNGERAASLEEEDEPLYGDTYLPRKSKIGVATKETTLPRTWRGQ